MLKRIIISIVYLMMFHTSCITAESISTPCDDWRCHGSFYWGGGFVFSHLLLNDNPIMLLPGFVTTPQQAFPSDLFGLRFAFGDRIPEHPRYTYEVSYAQLLSREKTDQRVEVSRASKAISASLSYTFNPGYRLEARFLTGAILDSGTYSITGTVHDVYGSNRINFTDVFPFFGVSGVYNINSKCSLKLTEQYQLVHYNLNANAAFVSLVSLQYYPA